MSRKQKNSRVAAAEREEQIRARAYLIWLEEGQPEGRHKEHWEQAEREIDALAKPRRSRARRVSRSKK